MSEQKSIYGRSAVMPLGKLRKTLYGLEAHFLDTRKYISLRIQTLCAEKGFNINSLARKSGVPPSTLKNIVHGNSRNPGVITIKLLCDGLGISLYDFFDVEEFRSMELEDIE